MFLLLSLFRFRDILHTKYKSSTKAKSVRRKRKEKIDESTDETLTKTPFKNRSIDERKRNHTKVASNRNSNSDSSGSTNQYQKGMYTLDTSTSSEHELTSQTKSSMSKDLMMKSATARTKDINLFSRKKELIQQLINHQPRMKMQKMQQKQSTHVSMTTQENEQQQQQPLQQQLIRLSAPTKQHEFSVWKQESTYTTWVTSSSYHKHAIQQPHRHSQLQYQQQPQYPHLFENQQVQLQVDQQLQHHQGRRFVQPSTQYSQRQIINVDGISHDQRLDELNSARIEPWINRRSIGDDDLNLTRVEPWHNRRGSLQNESNMSGIEPWLNRRSTGYPIFDTANLTFVSQASNTNVAYENDDSELPDYDIDTLF
jgi:hypothetical protein